MKTSLTPSARSKRLVSYVQSGLATLALCTPLVLIPSTPAQAGWRDIFRGETSGSASGRSRGGGIRDTRCLVGQEELLDNTVQVQQSADDDGQIVALLPGTAQTTSQSTPSFFLYVPFDRQGDAMDMVFELATQGANNQRQVVDSIRLSLPSEPGLVEFQLPAHLALDKEQRYDWSFRLKCSVDTATETPDTPDIEESTDTDRDVLEVGDLNISILSPSSSEGSTPQVGKVLQEVFGTIQFVEPPLQLRVAQTTAEVTDDYQAYVDNDMWLELVPTLAANSSSDFQLFLQDEFGEYDIPVDVDASGATIIEKLEPVVARGDELTGTVDVTETVAGQPSEADLP